jgi:hypothetical protein
MPQQGLENFKDLSRYSATKQAGLIPASWSFDDYQIYNEHRRYLSDRFLQGLTRLEAEVIPVDWAFNISTGEFIASYSESGKKCLDVLEKTRNDHIKSNYTLIYKNPSLKS